MKTTATTFGDSIDIPGEGDAVVVAVRLGSGQLEPVGLFLPHQVYTHVIERLIAGGEDDTEVWAVRIKSEGWTKVSPERSRPLLTLVSETP